MRTYFTSYYSLEQNRDLRFDFIRGLAMAIVVINHLPTPSYYYIFSMERIGVVSGAELFVILSGLVLGFAHNKYIKLYSWRQSAKKLLRRAFLLYKCVVIVSLAAWILPHIAQSFRILTTWTDPAGKVVQLYPEDALMYPHKLLINIIFIKSTPWQFNIIGLYIILLLAAPLALRMLVIKKRFLLLVISLALYVIAFIFKIKLTNFAFEKSFPLLIWQFPFVCALVTGYSYNNLAVWVNTKQGLIVRGIVLMLFFIFIFFTLNNYWIHESYTYLPTLRVIKPEYFYLVYSKFFMERTWLGAGRLLNAFVVIAALCEILNMAWPFLKKCLGWWTIPIGQASLYIFILHLAMISFVSAVSNYTENNLLYNTLVHTLVLIILWICVKTRFLFSIIPR